MIGKNNHRINFVLPDTLHSAFVSAYPACLSTFLRNALEFAVLDKQTQMQNAKYQAKQN